MTVLVGLGNPGSDYSDTKHNFGFWVVDRFVEKKSLTFQAGRGDYLYAKKEDLICVKPTSYMNNSGISVADIKQFFKVMTEDLLVIYDDIDLLCLYRFPRKILSSDIFSLKNNDYMK